MTKPTIILGCVAACLTAVVAGCGRGAIAHRLVSTQHEILIGDKAAPELEQMLGGKVADAQMQAYVQKVGQKLAAVAERRMPYEFFIVESDVPNSFSLPGGRIYVTVGMMNLVRSERELAAVLANQVGHTCRRDPIKLLYDQMGHSVLVRTVRLATEDEDESGYRSARAVAHEIIRAQHTRKDEILADQLAMRYLARAGYNPWGLAELLTTIHNTQKLKPEEVIKYLESHPLTRKRLKLAMVTAEVDYFYFNRMDDPDTAQDFNVIRDRLQWYASRRHQGQKDPRLVHLQPK
jgi:predicted Zn-dependent protease